MVKLACVAFGGALGSVLRYAVSGLSYRIFPVTFPTGTLIVNLSGSLLIGFLWGLFEATAYSQEVRVFLFIGVLGGFTTFSTFSLESFHLIRHGEYMYAFWNMFLSLVFGVAFVFAGYFLSRAMINAIR